MVVQQKKEKPQDGVFIITAEDSCPLYEIGEEIRVENFQLSVSGYKQVCLYLTQTVSDLLKPREKGKHFNRLGNQPSLTQRSKDTFSCPGCVGTIDFEYKQEKDYATLQMKLLRDKELQRRQLHLQKFFGVLRDLTIFEPLDDDSLRDLTLLLELKTILPDKVVLKKGDPGSHLYILLRGKVAAIGDDGSKIMDITPGEIFGETSLLSGELASNAIHTQEASQLAMLSGKNFKSVLKKFPVLQMFLFKLLIERAQTSTLQSGNITSGMTGELTEISAVDLFQLINSSLKTGTILLTLTSGQGKVYFEEGEIIHVDFQNLKPKDALFTLLGNGDGSFSYRRGIPTELQGQEPIGGFMGLMMEGVQHLDENKKP